MIESRFVDPIRIPPQLADAVNEDDSPARLEWLAALPDVVVGIASACARARRSVPARRLAPAELTR